jgi:hypothetical protein
MWSIHVIFLSKSKSRYNWWSVSQYVKVLSPFWDLWPDIFCPRVVFESYCLVSVGRPLWREVGSDLISPRVEINSGVETDKAASAFTASIASAYRLSTNKITLSDLNNDIPGLDRLLRYKKKMRKLWQETRDPGCKTAVNWVSKTITHMTWEKALERW